MSCSRRLSWAEGLWARQLSEQNFTSFQLRSHFLRQVMARPQVSQILDGGCDWLVRRSGMAGCGMRRAWSRVRSGDLRASRGSAEDGRAVERLRGELLLEACLGCQEDGVPVLSDVGSSWD